MPELRRTARERRKGIKRVHLITKSCHVAKTPTHGLAKLHFSRPLNQFSMRCRGAGGVLEELAGLARC